MFPTGIGFYPRCGDSLVASPASSSIATSSTAGASSSAPSNSSLLVGAAACFSLVPFSATSGAQRLLQLLVAHALGRVARGQVHTGRISSCAKDLGLGHHLRHHHAKHIPPSS